MRNYLYGFRIKSGMTMVFTALFVLLIGAPSIYAQEPSTYNDAFLQYNLKMEDYNKTHEEYVLRRSQYIRFKTLKSENDARAATVAMLQARDDVVMAYLTAIRKRLEETKGLPSDQKSTITIQLDNEIGFFKDHKARIPSTGTLDDLVADSKLAQDEFTKDQDLFYQTLLAVGDGRILDVHTRLNEKFSELKAKIETIRAETRPEYVVSVDKMQAIDRFIFESENKIQRADDKRKEAEDVSRLNGRMDPGEYNRRIGILGEAQQLLKEASSFLKEIVSQVKRQ